jgi:hypothetical protein
VKNREEKSEEQKRMEMELEALGSKQSSRHTNLELLWLDRDLKRLEAEETPGQRVEETGGGAFGLPRVHLSLRWLLDYPKRN